MRLHHLHTVSIIHQNRDALFESVLNRTPWTAKSVGSGMAHTEASQTAPHPWIHLASPVAAQTPVMQDPSTSASCAGLAHAPNFVATAIVGGSALRHEPTTITVVLAPHAAPPPPSGCAPPAAAAAENPKRESDFRHFFGVVTLHKK